MSDVSDATRQFWIDTLLGWAEDRLMPPQMDECRRALDWRAAVEQAERAQMERDCAQVCECCANIGKNYGDQVCQAPTDHGEDGWEHAMIGGGDDYREYCWGGGIRAAYTAQDLAKRESANSSAGAAAHSSQSSSLPLDPAPERVP